MWWGRMNDRLRELLLVDDETLVRKGKMKNEGSALIFLGVCLVIMGVAHHLFLEILYENRITWIAISGGVVLLGAVCLFFGIRTINKIGQSVAESWGERNGYTVEEMLEYNRECRLDSTWAVHTEFWSIKPPEDIYGLKTGQLAETGLITDHWFKAPDTISVDIMRIVDIAAIWFEPRELSL